MLSLSCQLAHSFRRPEHASLHSLRFQSAELYRSHGTIFGSYTRLCADAWERLRFSACRPHAVRQEGSHSRNLDCIFRLQFVRQLQLPPSRLISSNGRSDYRHYLPGTTLATAPFTASTSSRSAIGRLWQPHLKLCRCRLTH